MHVMNRFLARAGAVVVAGVALSTVVVTAASASGGGGVPIHPGALNRAGSVAGRAGALRPISNRDFAGYQTAVTAGSATSSAASFTVPTLSCTTKDRVIAPDVAVAGKTVSAAGVSIGCAAGKAVYFPFLVANGAEADYASTHFAAGDVINLSASVTTSGFTVQVTDATKNVSVATTITGAGASANTAWIGDDSWYRNGSRLGVPNFGKLTFTNCLIDGKSLGSWQPKAYQRVNGSGTVEIATGGPWPGGEAFNTLYRNS